MIRFCSVVVLMWVLFSCSQTTKTAVRVYIDGMKQGICPAIETPDSICAMKLDSMGLGVFELEGLKNPVYAYFIYGQLKLPLYLEPGKGFELAVKLDGRNVIPEFCGEGAKKNEYLNSLIFADFPDTLNEQSYIRTLEEQEQLWGQCLDSMHFEASFVQMERQRLHYLVYSRLTSYVPVPVGIDSTGKQIAVLSPVYYNYLREQIREDESLMVLKEYKEAVSSFVEVYAVRDLENPDDLDLLKAKINYVRRNMAAPEVISYLVDRYMTEYVTREGIAGLGSLLSVYDEKVIDPDRKALFQALCDRWAVIAPGQPSPRFTYQDVNGEEVCLDSLAGNYVYIDIWATWCAPCRKELPGLRDLAYRMRDNLIRFVSISCDEDRTAWETFVKEGGWGGIQLHNGGDHDFLKAYMIRSIPRFILLDREGNIINPDMTRPSDPETITALQALEGI